MLAGTRVESLQPAPGGLVRVDVVGPATRANPPEIALRPGASFLLATADADDCA
ncbi:MAG TPA: hypothetical protein VGH28_02620 [Polyangiaceae bacterium]